MNAVQHHEVVVVGAGPAGSSCARALARAGIGPVCLVHGGESQVAVGETIPPDARLLLERLGLLQEFLAEQHAPSLGSCSAWGSDTPGYNDFVLNPQGCGWHLDRTRFDEFLRRQAQSAGAMCLEGWRLSEVEASGGGFRLKLRSAAGAHHTSCARFVVDASGRAAAFARRIGARRRPLDRLTFVYGFFDAARATSRSRLTLLEAVREGWWYAAGLPGERLAVALAGDAAHIRGARLAEPATWLAAGQATRLLAQRLAGCRFLDGSLVARVAASFLLEPAGGERWCAVGDAASVFDPLSGGGIYKAMADGLDAAQSLHAAISTGGALAQHHAAGVRARFEEYLVNRNHFYAIERRWPDSAFWQSRQSRMALGEAA